MPSTTIWVYDLGLLLSAVTISNLLHGTDFLTTSKQQALFNPPLLRPNSSPPFHHPNTNICKSLHSHSCSVSVEQIPVSITINIRSILRTHQNVTCCYLSTGHSLKNWKLHFTNLIPLPPLPRTVSTLNIIHISSLAVCLPAWPIEMLTWNRFNPRLSIMLW